jgi:hypothetical protein
MCHSQWNGGWPIQLSASSPRTIIENAVLDSDAEYIQCLMHGARAFMAAVSPWFFTVSLEIRIEFRLRLTTIF